MPCPLCNCTLQNFGLDQVGRYVFWCATCGTTVAERVGEAGEVRLREVSSPTWAKAITEGSTLDYAREMVAEADRQRRREAADAQAYGDLVASGGIVDAP